jgi:hypothetical protein
MKHLFEPARAEEVRQRLEQLQPDSPRQWGKMDPAQMMAHCSMAIDMAEGKIVSPRIMIGRLLGPFAKKAIIVNGQPIRRNSQTTPSVLITDERNFTVEKKRLLDTINGFVAGGPAICTKQPHFFFGPLTPQEWASLMYSHLDHHLQQFGV